MIYIHREDGPPATESSFFSLMPMFNKMGRFAEGHNSVCVPKIVGKKENKFTIFDQMEDPLQILFSFSIFRIHLIVTLKQARV